MRIRAVAFSVCFSWGLGCTLSMAQNANDVVNIFGGLMRSAIAQATQAEWKKLPPNEIVCIDQALRQRGASVAAVAQEGVTPSDQRIAGVRAACQAQARGQTPPIATSPIKSVYSIDGLTLGSRVQFDSAAYREYQCAPSKQFASFVWCQKKRAEREPRGQFASYYSLLHSTDGIAQYINRYLEPAFFTGNEAAEEIDRLSKKHGALPRVIPLPQNSKTPYGVMAVWGNVVLERINANSANALAAGRDVQEGVMIDHVGNYQISAQLGLPIYRLRGGAGYIWAGSWDESGRGTLRFLAIDPSAFNSPPPRSREEDNPVQRSPTVTSDKTSPELRPSPALQEPIDPEKPKRLADERRAADEQARQIKLAELEEAKHCERLKGSKAYFVAACVVRGLERSQEMGALSAAKKELERAQEGLDCSPGALTKLQEMSNRSALRILDSGAITKLMDFTDAINLECKKAAAVNLEEN